MTKAEMTETERDKDRERETEGERERDEDKNRQKVRDSERQRERETEAERQTVTAMKNTKTKDKDSGRGRQRKTKTKRDRNSESKTKTVRNSCAHLAQSAWHPCQLSPLRCRHDTCRPLRPRRAPPGCGVSLNPAALPAVPLCCHGNRPIRSFRETFFFFLFLIHCKTSM